MSNFFKVLFAEEDLPVLVYQSTEIFEDEVGFPETLAAVTVAYEDEFGEQFSHVAHFPGKVSAAKYFDAIDEDFVNAIADEDGWWDLEEEENDAE